MKKHSDESLKAKVDPEPLNIPGKPYVRYVGFGSIEGGRRLRFAVNSNGQKSVEVTIEVSHASFTRASGISIQDAAPMAYEKIVELLATEDTEESNELCLTDERYCAIHNSSSQFTEAHIFNERRKATIRRCGLMNVRLRRSAVGLGRRRMESVYSGMPAANAGIQSATTSY